MTKEEKELVLKDLCARLPYGVKTSEGYGILELSPRTDVIYIVDNGHMPYLRPLSSMTEEERDELSDYVCERVMPDKSGITFPPYPTDGIRVPFEWMQHWLDWLNSHHFDYRGLIPMGLASEAPEGMYR